MDRQDVEYIQREDTDVFDEFGRKKKKRSQQERDERPSVRFVFLSLSKNFQKFH